MQRILASVLFLLLLTSPSLAADKLTVLLDWFVNPDHAPLIIAREKGYFDEVGLDVELIPPADPSAPPRLVAAGEGDVGQLVVRGRRGVARVAVTVEVAVDLRLVGREGAVVARVAERVGVVVVL